MNYTDQYQDSAEYDLDTPSDAGTFSFQVTLTGPDLDGTTPVPYAGFYLTVDEPSVGIILQDSDGYGAAVDIYQDGSGTTQVAYNDAFTVTPVSTPEPTTLSCSAMVLTLIGGWGRRRSVT